MVTITKSEDSYKDYLTTYIFLLWDGLGFFGFDDNKLERLKGRKPKWHDKFSNKRWITAQLIFISVIVSVLYHQF